MAEDSLTAAKDRRLTAWSLVAVQLALIAAIVLLPRRTDWPVPAWLAVASTAATWVGIVLMVIAGLGLGRGRTATPIPNAHARLRTGGLYRLVRHPIYTGLLLFAAGEVVASGSVAVAIAGVLLLSLVTAKARWEEARLRERFAGYDEYARRTPRFVPCRPRRRPPPSAPG